MWSCHVSSCCRVIIISVHRYDENNLLCGGFYSGRLSIYSIVSCCSEKFDSSSSSSDSKLSFQVRRRRRKKNNKCVCVSGVSWVVVPPVGRGVVRIDRSHNNSNLISLFDVVVNVPYIVICTLPFVRLYNRSQSTISITIF